MCTILILLEYFVENFSSGEPAVLYADGFYNALCAELFVRCSIYILVENDFGTLTFQVDTNDKSIAASKR